jgi:nucleoid-associated protein YgaU
MKFNLFNKKVKPDLLFFIVGFLLFPLVVLTIVFTIFNQQNDLPVSSPISGISVDIQEVPSNSEGIVDVQNEVGQTSSTNTIRTGHSAEGLQKSIETQQNIESSGIWQATQYSKGDIERKTYVVQLGDTLWQIANAYYGDGSNWIKILENNKESIGYLPNGEQALIIPGQVLNL